MARLELGHFVPADLGTKALGAALAAASAAFPIYIYNNPDRFGPPRMEYAALDVGTGEAESRKARFEESDEANAPGLALDAIEVGTATLRPELDGVMTGTIALPQPRPIGERQPPPEQPFPGDLEPVNVLFVSAGGALVLAEGGIEIIGEGDLLPDGSKVLSIRGKDGVWEILTTGERVLTWRS